MRTTRRSQRVCATLLNDLQHREDNVFWSDCEILQHYYESSFWKCGFRNIQIIAQAIRLSDSKWPELAEIFPVQIDIRFIQTHLERAWINEWDPCGKKYYKGKLVGKRSWIGALEASTFFRVFGIRTYVVDFTIDCSIGFSRKNCVNQHHALMKIIWEYFSISPSFALFQQEKNTHGEICLPVYLQYHGHAVTVVGVTKKLEDDEDFSLVLLDPALSSRSIKVTNTRRTVASAKLFLKHKSYQVMFIRERNSDSCLMPAEEKEKSKNMQVNRVKYVNNIVKCFNSYER
mmetsp:Transcript_10555/g.13231  ORF Transcript_10555/g.13231 Transcript_10555/m.13231 type:complete len:288 (+) Transcript_10555:185-1048(+)